MQKLIVGCGYLGRRVAAAWQKAGHEVTALTRSAASAAELARLGMRPVIGDICDPETLAALPVVETVLFAVGFDRTSGRSQHEVYVDGLRHVLNQVASRCERFIDISSSSVYGQSAGEWVDETSLCEPVQPGGQCCLTAEALVREFFPATNQTAAQRPFANVLRLSGLYGPDRLLSRIESLRAGEPLSGQGEAWLNLIHVDDAVAAVLACEQRGQPGETYLISDDSPIRREEYYSRLARLVGAPPPLFADNQPAKRGSGGLNKRCSNKRARAELALALTYPTITAGLPHALGLSATATTTGESPSNWRTLPAE
ncbi:MAG: SDR family oxidoreductase [Candidatus Saccharimonas sp.]|nr:SDR family oxidoreductase [Planctomycetaceae bacterium]